MLCMFMAEGFAQKAPPTPDRPWDVPAGQQQLKGSARPAPAFLPDPAKIYSLADLVNIAEQNNPQTRVAWENARARAADLGIARAALYPTLAAIALAESARNNIFFAPNFYRQTADTFSPLIHLEYVIFDFGRRSQEIAMSRSNLLAADFQFNDTHRRIIFQVGVFPYTGHHRRRWFGPELRTARSNTGNLFPNARVLECPAQLSWTLFDGWARENRLAKAKADQRQLPRTWMRFAIKWKTRCGPPTRQRAPRFEWSMKRLPAISGHQITGMVRFIGSIVVAGLLALSACGSHESVEQRHRDANSPAGKVGQAAHKAAVEADKAGRVVARKLDKAAHDAHEGWKEAARKDQDKK